MAPSWFGRSALISSLWLTSLGSVSFQCSAIESRSVTPATIDLATSIGEAAFLGAGFIYGWPDNGTEADNSIPDSLVTGIKFNACRAGGAQISDPGWAEGGYEGYIGRFNSALSNYRTTRKYNGDLILLVHDMWGADGGSDSSSPFPGDDGDWSETDAFLTQLVKDIKANDMLDGLVIDLWNEPDLDIFWARSWPQYLDYYVRAHQFFKRELPDTLISGPSMAHSPTLNDRNWTDWMSAVSEAKTIPDIYSWHQIGDWEREPDTTIPDFHTLRDKFGLPERPFDINEYAWPTEQNPANSVFYLAQLERHNARGLRANWGSGSELHDFMANLVYKSDDGTYQPNGEWHVYNYYANMTGNRPATTATSDRLFDVFATTSNNTIKILAGTRTVPDSYDIEIYSVSSLGFPPEGSVAIRSYRFDWNGAQGAVDAPVDLGCEEKEYAAEMVS
ncbi:hypothetical protein FQN50_004515 [Emmonsiellopsis sp. PD_5]|nr:hypothetical protein FQN50_004515 [Emmonsiellopsis sp. PD_5]